MKYAHSYKNSLSALAHRKSKTYFKFTFYKTAICKHFFNCSI